MRKPKVYDKDHSDFASNHTAVTVAVIAPVRVVQALKAQCADENFSISGCASARQCIDAVEDFGAPHLILFASATTAAIRALRHASDHHTRLVQISDRHDNRIADKTDGWIDRTRPSAILPRIQGFIAEADTARQDSILTDNLLLMVQMTLAAATRPPSASRLQAINDGIIAAEVVSDIRLLRQGRFRSRRKMTDIKACLEPLIAEWRARATHMGVELSADALSGVALLDQDTVGRVLWLLLADAVMSCPATKSVRLKFVSSPTHIAFHILSPAVAKRAPVPGQLSNLYAVQMSRFYGLAFQAGEAGDIAFRKLSIQRSTELAEADRHVSA